MSLTLAERVAATDAVVARFRGHAFSWRDRRTCLHLARAQMRGMGHRPPSIPDVRSAIAAKRALTRAGFDTLEALMDSLGLTRIAPLAMWPGDIAIGQGDPASGGFDALGIWAGSALLGYHGDGAEGVVPMRVSMGELRVAWRL